MDKCVKVTLVHLRSVKTTNQGLNLLNAKETVSFGTCDGSFWIGYVPNSDGLTDFDSIWRLDFVFCFKVQSVSIDHTIDHRLDTKLFQGGLAERPYPRFGIQQRIDVSLRKRAI